MEETYSTQVASLPQTTALREGKKKFPEKKRSGREYCKKKEEILQKKNNSDANRLHN